MKVNRILRTLIILVVLGSTIGCDQISKNLVRQRVGYHEEFRFLSNHLTLTIISAVLVGLKGEIQVKRKIYNGVMPSYSFLNDEEVAQLITYIKNSFGNKGNKVNAVEVSAIRNSRK